VRRLFDFFVRERDHPHGARRRLLRTTPGRRLRARRDLAVSLRRERLHIPRNDIARDDQNGVFGGVKARVIGERVFARQFLDLMVPADDRRAIGVMGEQRRLQSLVELRAGVVVDAHAALFEHDLALGTDHFVGEHEIGHAIRLEAHQGLEMLLAYTLEIGGVVVSREGVLLPAELRDEIGEGALGMLLGSLEHQMLEKMRDARLAKRIVGGAVLIPDHMGHDRRAGVGNDHDFHAIVEFGMSHARRGGGGRRCRAGRESDRDRILRRHIHLSSARGRKLGALNVSRLI